MADLKGSYSSSGSPKFHYDITYSQTKRTGSSASYRVNLKVRLDNSYSKYAYGIRAYVKINGKSVEKQIKSNGGMWSGSAWQGTWTFDVTTSVGTGGGTLSAEVKVWGTDGGSAPNLTIGSKTVSLSTWNTAPTWSTNDGNINGWKQNKVIAENTGSVTVNFPKATDKEGNKIYYDVYRYVNDKSNAKVASKSTGSSVTDNISSLGQGTKIKYRFQANDGSLYSNDSWSYTYTKNRMSPATPTIGGDIRFDTGSVSLNFSGHSNTDGNSSFSFVITSPNITVYNGTVTGNTTLTIYRSGNKPTTPYVMFNDIKNYFREAYWQGNLTLNVETRNAYGSKASKSTIVKVDLRTNPNPAGTPNAGGQVTVAGGSYFIPSKNAISLSWGAGSDKLGEGVTYDVLGCVKGGQFAPLITGLTSTSTSLRFEAVTKATDYSFKIVTRTKFNYTSESPVRTITLHYYNQPKIYIQNINRSATEFTAQIVSTTDTSISAVAINSRQYQDKNGTWQNFAGTPYNLRITGLAEDTVITRSIKVTDNSGQAEGSSSYNYTISSYVPIFSIRKNGVAVNTLPDGINKFKVNGRAQSTAWVNKGYPSSHSGGDNVNKWTKIASFRVTGRYGDASATIDFLDSGSGSALPVSGRLKCRLKQQNELGQSSHLGLILENPVNCSVDNFYLVVTTNTTSQVIAELWYRSSVGWNSVYFYPSQILGEVNMFQNQPFQNGIPSGQNLKATYSPRETTVGINAISGANKNGYWGIARPDGNDGDWIRTTQNGLIPYQSGGHGSLGTEGWNFNTIYGKTLYENNTALANKYVNKTDGVFNSKLLTVGTEGDKKGSFGVGGSDVYIRNVKSNKYLALKDDGRIIYDDKKILTDIQSTPLWQGYHHMSKSETVKPSKKLSECNNGWILVWSDWNDGGKGENFNFVYTYVPKNTPWKSGQNHTFPLSAGEGDKGYTNKTLYIYDDKFTGHDTNKQGSAYDIVIRAVLEY